MLGNEEIIFHSQLIDILDKYSSKDGILNTLFYGPPGSGKDFLINQLFRKLTGNQIQLKCQKVQDSTLNSTYYSNDVYILIDGYEWKSSKISLGKFIEEITRTNNVSTNRTKYIYIRYLDVLSEHHQSLRQLLEESFLNTRFIFSCRSRDKIDTALLSRCVQIRVPAPSIEKLVAWQENTVNFSGNDLTDIIKNSNRNANTLVNMIIDYNVNNNVIENANELIAKNIYEVLKEPQLIQIQELCEKLFKSTLFLAPIFKCYLRLIPPNNKKKVKQSAKVIQEFLTKSSDIIFDMNIVLFELAAILC